MLEMRGPSFLDAFRFQNPQPFELDGRQHPVPDLLARRVVEDLDVIEHIMPGFLAGFVSPAPDALALERGEVAIGNRVVMAVAASAHRVLKFVSPDDRSPVQLGELRALIRVDQHPLLRLAPPYRHVQRLADSSASVRSSWIASSAIFTLSSAL